MKQSVSEAKRSVNWSGFPQTARPPLTNVMLPGPRAQVVTSVPLKLELYAAIRTMTAM